MKSHRSLTLLVVVLVLGSTSCSRISDRPVSSTAASLTANTTSVSAPERPFARHMLSVSGLQTMNEYMLPAARSRLDEEPAGDTDAGYDPATLDPTPVTEELSSGSAEVTEEVAQDPSGEEVSTDRNKFLWAKRSYGEAIKASPKSNGIIVLYADESVYDISRLMDLVQTGRNQIVEGSELGTERVQLVFGGYRGTPQVELWVLPQGSMPEFRVEDRIKANEPEN